MKKLDHHEALQRRAFLRFNIVLAFLVFIGAVYMVVTGEYATLQERKEFEAIYNYVAIGSLVYMSVVWIGCVMSKPFWFTGSASNS